MKNWSEAVEYCQMLNVSSPGIRATGYATLADPQSNAENECVQNLTDCDSEERYWLGVSRNSSSDRFVSHRTGIEWTDAPWHCDEPKNKTCVQLARNITTNKTYSCETDRCKFRWDDTACKHSYRFFCQADIDECSGGLHSCHFNGSYCHNTYGSYECPCREELKEESPRKFYICEAFYQDPTDRQSLQDALDMYESKTVSLDGLLHKLKEVTKLPTLNDTIASLVANVASAVLHTFPRYGAQFDNFTRLLSHLHNFTADSLQDSLTKDASGGDFSMASWALESSPYSSAEVHVFHTPQLSVVNGHDPGSSIQFINTTNQPAVSNRANRTNAVVLIFGMTEPFWTNQVSSFTNSCHGPGGIEYLLNTPVVYSIQLGTSESSAMHTELEFKALCAAQEPYCSRYNQGKWSDRNNSGCEEIELGNIRAVSTGQVVSCRCNSSGIYGLLASPIDDSQSLQDLYAAVQALNSSPVTGEVITNATKAIEGVASRPSISEKVGEVLTSVVDLIIQAPASSLHDSQARDNGTTRLLKSIDAYFSQVILQPFEVRNTNSSSLLTRVEAVETGSAFPNTTYQVTNDNINVPTSQASDAQPAVAATLPANVTDYVRLYRGQAYVPVQISSFKSSALFVDSNQASLGENATPVASAVISVRVGNSSLKLENRDFVTRFALTKAGTNPNCSFWDFNLNSGQGGWSSDGCETIASRRVTLSDSVECRCDHLTHFGVLLSASPESRTSLEVLTLISTAFSFICLLLLLLTVLFFRKFWREVRIKILIQLVTSLAVSGLLFVIMAHVDMRNNTNACLALAVLLHYFPLAMFFWTLVEAIYLYRLLVAVYSKEVNNLFCKFCVFAWGLPAVIVFATAAAGEFTLDNYDLRGENKSNFCRVKGNSFWAALVAPICTIIAVNTLLFVRICREILRKRPSSSKHTLSDRRKQFLIAVSIAFLLGLSWLSILAALDSSAPFFLQYVFAALQVLTSFLLLLFHVVLRKEIRQEWLSTLTSSTSFFSTGRDSRFRSFSRMMTSTKRTNTSLFSSSFRDKSTDKSAVSNTNTVALTKVQVDIEHTSLEKTLSDRTDRSGSDSGISTQ